MAAIASGRTLNYIAERGIKAMVALTGELYAEQMITQYHDAATAAGRDLPLGGDMALGFGFYIADSKEEAIERVRPFHDERYKWFAPFGFVRYTDEQGRPWGTPGAPTRVPRFDAAADGFVRSEGCGVLVLKRLSQAEADGDRIWGLVKGTAINQSGTSAAMPVPNGPAQERVMEEALARAGVSPADVDYLEAHGTGTELGDSIELRALSSVYGRERDAERPLLLGSVKTNIGHSEWASGMASIIKSVLAMQRGVIPAHLHFTDPNPNFDWDRLPVRIASEQISWPLISDRPPLSAVNSFGLSGTNAHVVLKGRTGSTEGANAVGRPAWPSSGAQAVPLALPSWYGEASEPVEARQARAARVLPLSGKSPEALRQLAGAYLSWLDSTDVMKRMETDPALLVSDMAWTAGTGRSHFPHRAGVIFHDTDDLRAGLERVLASAAGTGEPATAATVSPAFVYPGLAGQWAGMYEELYLTEPVFRSVLGRCCELLGQEQDGSLLESLFGRDEPFASPSRPERANAASFALELALTALWESVGVNPRAVLGQGIGEITAAHIAGALTLEDGLRLATALIGPEAALPIVPAAAPALTLVSSVTGGLVHNSGELDNARWRRLVAGGGNFQKEVRTLADQGASLIIAMGPAFSFDEVAEAMQVPLIHGIQPSPDDPSDGSKGFARAVAAAYEAGAPVNFRGLFTGEERSRIRIPGYPFQRRSFWVQRRGPTP